MKAYNFTPKKSEITHYVCDYFKIFIIVNVLGWVEILSQYHFMYANTSFMTIISKQGLQYVHLGNRVESGRYWY